MRDMRKESGNRCVDVCNGDADGLCSILQWRMHEPKEATMLALLDCDTSLVGRVHTRPGDEFLMCDIPMEPNRSTLLQLLAGGARVQYFNHQVTEEIPWHPLLQTTVDFSRDACTSLIVDRLLGGKYRGWAVVGAYGKHLTHVADKLAMDMGLVADVRAQLRELGELISYNALVPHEDDACIAPARLYEHLSRYPSPTDFLRSEPIISELDSVRRDDLYRATELTPYWQDAYACVYVLPDAPWAHRVAGGLDKAIAAREPTRAHAFLCPAGDTHFRVTVHAARNTSVGSFGVDDAEMGSVRPRAWVIHHLPHDEIDHFIRAFSASRWGRLRSPVFRALH